MSASKENARFFNFLDIFQVLNLISQTMKVDIGNSV